MNEDLKQKQKLLLTELRKKSSQLPDEYWFDVDELRETLKVTTEEFTKVIRLENKFIKNGSNQITTRGQYRKRTPFLKKLIHVIKNRID